jgi:methionyl-tRNA synthetase
MGISRLGNKYFQDHKPWDLAKNDKSRCATVIGVAANLTKLLAAILEPYIPATSVKIYQVIIYLIT